MQLEEFDGAAALESAIWVRDGTQIQLGYPRKVARVARVQGHIMRDSTSGDERIVGSRCRLAARCAQRGSDAPKRPGTLGVERKDFEIRLCLLQVLLTCATFSVGPGDMGPYGQLGEGYRTYHGLIWQLARICQPAEHNHRRRVEHPS